MYTTMSKQWKRRNAQEEEEETEEEEGTYVKVIDNNVYFYADVSSESVIELICAIKTLTKKLQIVGITYGIDSPAINLYIHSDGGEVHSALSVFDMIKDNPVDVRTIVSGNASSAATIISLAGHYRTITKNSYMLIHNISSEFWGKMHEFEDEMKNMTKLTNNLKRIYKENTNLTKTQLDGILKKDLLLDAKTCLKYQLVDAIE